MLVALACLWGTPGWAVDVGVSGMFPGKALLVINGGEPRIVPVGVRTAEGVQVLAIDGDSVAIEIDGRRRQLRVGENVVQRPQADARTVAVITADTAGHFLANGSINGMTVRFIVDTGASLVSIGASEARRLGIDPSSGSSGVAQTANGLTQVSRVRLKTVKVGEIVLNDVEAVVHAQDMPVVLLGMSFLNRMEMQRNGDTMTLKKNY
ncbi:retropepsin-like aspartic protease family protein [Propionivibrio dicarboxylicus]|uniref:Aspartyl protease family protein n=1 Tax=Propionivibrio dicarboxylicus TaxID=83767 RepID=A0A1G8BK89_9RHOO|nr:TIGR02281 family clan AA aspartic protease [Propionivibrio dicarboxylicus]SDH33615.1 aspartyl protease family protein [Propionivibrio dicarboxylicus]